MAFDVEANNAGNYLRRLVEDEYLLGHESNGLQLHGGEAEEWAALARLATREGAHFPQERQPVGNRCVALAASTSNGGVAHSLDDRLAACKAPGPAIGNGVRQPSVGSAATAQHWSPTSFAGNGSVEQGGFTFAVRSGQECQEAERGVICEQDGPSIAALRAAALEARFVQLEERHRAEVQSLRGALEEALAFGRQQEARVAALEGQLRDVSNLGAVAVAATSPQTAAQLSAAQGANWKFSIATTTQQSEVQQQLQLHPVASSSGSNGSAARRMPHLSAKLTPSPEQVGTPPLGARGTSPVDTRLVSTGARGRQWEAASHGTSVAATLGDASMRPLTPGRSPRPSLGSLSACNSVAGREPVAAVGVASSLVAPSLTGSRSAGNLRRAMSASAPSTRGRPVAVEAPSTRGRPVAGGLQGFANDCTQPLLTANAIDRLALLGQPPGASPRQPFLVARPSLLTSSGHAGPPAEWANPVSPRFTPPFGVGAAGCGPRVQTHRSPSPQSSPWGSLTAVGLAATQQHEAPSVGYPSASNRPMSAPCQRPMSDLRQPALRGLPPQQPALAGPQFQSQHGGSQPMLPCFGSAEPHMGPPPGGPAPLGSLAAPLGLAPLQRLGISPAACPS